MAAAQEAAAEALRRAARAEQLCNTGTLTATGQWGRGAGAHSEWTVLQAPQLPPSPGFSPTVSSCGPRTVERLPFALDGRGLARSHLGSWFGWPLRPPTRATFG